MRRKYIRPHICRVSLPCEPMLFAQSAVNLNYMPPAGSAPVIYEHIELGDPTFSPGVTVIGDDVDAD